MRFTIRDLLWLTVVVALGVAWWVDRSRLAREVGYLLYQPSVEMGTIVSPHHYYREYPEKAEENRRESAKRLGWKLPNPSAPAPTLPSK